LLHIRPWEWDLLSVAEAEHCLSWVEKYIENQEG
jgi:hypothetical protein